jgi:hypothetical protein
MLKRRVSEDTGHDIEAGNGNLSHCSLKLETVDDGSPVLSESFQRSVATFSVATLDVRLLTTEVDREF